MKIAIATAMHGRHEAVKKFAANARYNGCDVYCAYTDKEDGVFGESLGFKMVYAPNKPLSVKHQKAVSLVYQTGGYDALLLMGSDNEIIGIDHYIAALKEYEAVVCMDIFFHEIGSNRKMHWQGYRNHRKGEPVGAGRCIRWDLLESWKGKVWQGRTMDYGLDSNLWPRINKSKYKILSSADGVRIIDWKDKDSMNSYDKLITQCQVLS